MGPRPQDARFGVRRLYPNGMTLPPSRSTPRGVRAGQQVEEQKCRLSDDTFVFYKKLQEGTRSIRALQGQVGSSAQQRRSVQRAAAERLCRHFCALILFVLNHNMLQHI